MTPPFPCEASRYFQRKGPAGILREARRKLAECGAGNRPSSGDKPLGAALREVLGEATIKHLSDRTGYSFWTAPVNAREVMQWVQLEILDGSHRSVEVKGGMSRLPDKIATLIQSLGGQIALRHSLTALTPTDDASGELSMEFELPDRKTKVRAGRVILALPREGLAGITGIQHEAAIKALCRAVVSWPAISIAVAYARPWWTKLGFRGGWTATDLPIRRFSYVGAEPWRANEFDGGGFLAFADGAAVSFWQTLLGENDWDRWLAGDHALVSEVSRQIDAIFGERLGHPQPAPDAVFVRDWSRGRFGGALHLWSLASTADAAIRQARAPLPGYGLHICGEAWSRRHGWIEGALESVEAVLSECRVTPRRSIGSSQ